MLTDNEIKELRKEYFNISDKIREMEQRQMEIDVTINNSVKEKVAGKFIPLEFGDKIRITKKEFNTWKDEYKFTNCEGFFGSWVLDGHQYTEDNGEGRVKLRLYQIKKDGTRSQKSDEIWVGHITNIEKI
jgi:dynactin complex subunit